MQISFKTTLRIHGGCKIQIITHAGYRLTPKCHPTSLSCSPSASSGVIQSCISSITNYLPSSSRPRASHPLKLSSSFARSASSSSCGRASVIWVSSVEGHCMWVTAWRIPRCSANNPNTRHHIWWLVLSGVSLSRLGAAANGLRAVLLLASRKGLFRFWTKLHRCCQYIAGKLSQIA